MKHLECVCGWKSKPYMDTTAFIGPGGQLACPECTRLKRNKNIEVYGRVKVVPDVMTQPELLESLKSLLNIIDKDSKVRGKLLILQIVREWIREREGL